jgi:hypothetical protein
MMIEEHLTLNYESDWCRGAEDVLDGVKPLGIE